MKKEDAEKFLEDTMDLPEDATDKDVLFLLMGSYIDERGDIWCLICNRPNECCICLEEDVINFQSLLKRKERRNER
jgi:hypothetical protein